MSSYLLFLHLYSFAATSKIGIDAASYFLPADSLLNGRGIPYKDFWDVKPAGLYLFSSVWLLVFGKSITAFKLLHFILISTVIFGIVRLYYKIFPKTLFAVISILSLFVFLSPRVQSQFLTIELFCLAFALTGLNILVTENWPVHKRAYWATFLILFGGQIKESYAPILLSLVPFIGYVAIVRKPQLKKTVLYALLGFFSCALLLLMFLLLTGSLSSYLELFMYLATAAKNVSAADWAIEFPKSTYVYLQYSILLFLLGIIPIYLYSKYRSGELGVSVGKEKIGTFKISTKLTEQSNATLIAIFYALGSWAGFIVQNRFGSHYDAQMVFPVMLLISIPLYVTLVSIRRNLLRLKKGKVAGALASALLILIITIAIFPKKQYFLDYPYKEAAPKNFINQLRAGQNPDLSLEEAIAKRTKNNDCIMHVYGWDVGATYFYSQRKPCTRYFLPPVPLDHIRAYAKDLVYNPPAAIVYSPEGAIDRPWFEEAIFDFPGVLKNCYEADSQRTNLYWPAKKYKTTQELRSCIKEVLLFRRQI